MKKKLKKAYYLAPACASLVLILGLLYYFLLSDFSRCTETVYVCIDEDDTADSLYAKLEPIATNHGLTGLHTFVSHSSMKEKLHTGRYAIEPGMSTFTLFRHLKNGRQTPLRLTIPEVRTMDRLAAYLGQKLMMDSASVEQAMTSEEVCRKLGYDTLNIPALFVPNTYEVYWNITVDAFLERMVKEHDAFWNYERRHKADLHGLSINEVCVLASIIDEETSNNQEKPMIAGMYMNRLKEGMPLQADPTVKFALGDFSIRRIYQNMLRVESPYNTYMNTGLPPGPIKIASVKGIDAVLNRASHDFLYMCAKEDFSGTHRFARTYKEHKDNAARYAKALNERNIR